MKKIQLCFASTALILGSLSGCNASRKDYVPNTYQIDFKNYNGEVLQTLTVKEGTIPEYTGVTPTRPEYQGVVYTFDGWLPEVVAATKDTEYYAKYSSEALEYTVTFNLNGGVATIPDQTHKWGEKVAKPEEEPAKPQDDDYIYTFDYWYSSDANVPFDFDNETVTSNLTLNAKYNAKVVSCIVTFVTNGGKEVLPIEVKKGSVLESLPTPERLGNKQYSYEFTKWYVDEGIAEPFDITTPITSNLVLYAGWNKVVNKYTITFKNYDGTVLEEQKYEYGSTPSCSVMPTKNEDDYATYKFVGWDKTIVDVEEDATYIAQFATDSVKWTHYLSVTPSGCEGYGIKEYWTNSHNEIVLSLPVGTITEGGTPTEDEINAIVAANPNDIRLIQPKGHNFDEFTGECGVEQASETIDVFDVYENDAAKGCGILNESTMEVAGYDEIYEYKHTYNDGVGWHIKNMFNDTSLDGVVSFEFYISTNGGQTFFAGPDGVATSGVQIHPHESFGDSGVIRGVQTSKGVWNITSSGFKFRRMSDAAAINSYSFIVQEGDANSLNTLFKNTNGWGASTLYVSAVKLSSLDKCGATNITAYAIDDMSSISKADNGMYKFNKNAVSIFKNLDITGLDSISFKVANYAEQEDFILFGNNSTCHGGIYCGEENNDTIIATKEPGTNNWTVRRQSGKPFYTIGHDGDEANYVVNDVQTLNQLFMTWSISDSLYIGDIVAKGNLKVSRLSITSQAVDVYSGDGTKGTATLNKTSEAITGFGKLYEYHHTYNDGVDWMIKNMFKDYSLSGVKTIEFYIDCMGKEFMFAGDDGTTSTSYEMHPSAGAQTPGYIRATQTEAGTWVVHSYGFAFRNMSNGAQVNEFTYTGRNTLNELFHAPTGSYGANTVTISDIIITK